MLRIFVLLLVGSLVAGCQTGLSSTELQTTNQKFKNSGSEVLLVDSAFSTLSAAEWMAESDMPLVLDRPMSASEVSYVLRKIGFEPSPAEISPWIGKNRSNLIKDLMEGLDASPIIDFPEWTKFEPRYWGHNDWSENKRKQADKAQATHRNAADAILGLFRTCTQDHITDNSKEAMFDRLTRNCQEFLGHDLS